jgi:TP901 family phage tail tape measure protein
MADVNANIDININSSNALAQLKSLQKQISQFHTSIAKSSESAALAQRGLQKNLLNSVNAISGFTAEMRTVKTSTESFTNSLEKNKFSMREYFRYAGASTKTFGRLFKSEFDTIGKVSEERVKRLQTQYIKMGRDTNGAMQAMAVMPTKLNLDDYSTKVQLTAQRQALFNQLMKQGSTNLLNFGKNTQWAGRQLMVGFTLPLMLVGSTATKTFMEMEAQAIKFKKVYGDLFTPKEETQQALDNITELGKSFTKYGVAVSTTVGLAAEAAAAGFSGLDLQRQTTEATRLSILGQIDSQKALETTISLQNAFGMSSEKLASSIDFLNAVENQTVVSLDDITTAIPKVAPVIQQLGGDVKDLTFFLAAMKEGGINASEGANALKSGLAALINPTGRASEMLKGFGINANEIVTKNKGDLKATVIEFAQALNELDPLNRAQAIEQMFGKFQFARLSTLFANVAKDGNQAARVLDLANASVTDLSALSEQELGMTADSAMNKFKKSVEDLKAALIPVGKAFLEAATPIVEFVGNILEKFGNLSEGTKRVITLLTVGIGAVGPVLLMTFGLLANGVANIIKLFLTLRAGYQRLTGQSQILGEQTQYMTMEQLDAAAAAHSLNQTHATLTQTFTAEASSIQKLIAAYSSATAASLNFARSNPGMMMPGRGVRKLANGIVSVPGPKGAGDIVPAMLSPGEAVVPADMAKKYAPLIDGMIAGNIPGFKNGLGIGDLKKNLGLFRAPYAVNKQTQGMDWQTLPEEIEAAIAAATNVLSKTTTDVEEINKKLGNLKRKQASHIVPDVTKMSVAGESVDIKNWNAKNLQADLGYVNSYINTIQQSDSIVENFNKNHIDKAAKSLNMSIAEVELEVEKFKKGIHPTTRQSAQVLQQVAMSDPGYQGQAAAAGLGVRLSGSYYETLGSRAYDPSKDISSSKTVQTKIAKLEKEVIAKSERLATNAVMATSKAAGTQSPSKKTIPIGEDIARGLEVGMESRVDDVAKSGQQLANAAVGGTRGGGVRNVPFQAPGQPAPSQRGIAISDPALLSMAYQENTMRDKLKKQAAATQVMNQRMDRLNKGFMAGTFALSSLSGVASMAGGNLGKFSEILFQITGPLFALSSVIQLLTGSKILNLIKNFKLGFGLASVALVAGTFALKAYNSAREKERQQTEAFTDVLKSTSKEADFLANKFSVIRRKGLGERFSVGTANQVVATPTRTKMDSYKEDKLFQETFKDTISGVRNLTIEKAQAALTLKGLQLLSEGVAKEEVQIIIDTIKEEAGKQQLVLDFSSISFEGEGLKNVGKQLMVGLSGFGKEFEKEFLDAQKFLEKYNRPTKNKDILPTISKEQTQELKNAGATVASFSDSLFKLADSGQIDLEKFNTAFSVLFSTISQQIPQSNAKISLMQNALTTLNPELGKVVSGVENFGQLQLLLQAASAGVSGQLIKNAASAYVDAAALEVAAASAKKAGQSTNDYRDSLLGLEAARRAVAASDKTLEDTIASLFKQLQIQNEAARKAFEDLNKQGSENPLLKRTKEIQKQTSAYLILRNANVDNTTATELSNDAEIASIIIANGKGKKLINLIKLVNQYKKAIKEQTKAAEENMSQEEKFKANVTRTLALANLREKLIDLEYEGQIKAENNALKNQENALQAVNDKIDAVTKSQIDPLRSRIDANNFALEKISLQEDIINEKYETQISALEKIETLNQDIANVQKQRLTIADALTRGDISAAASAIQDARAQQAESAISGQKNALTASRDAAIAGLGRNALEKENKQLQYEISVIENTQLLTLQQQKTEIEGQIEATQRSIAAIELKVQGLKDAALYAGKTKDEIAAQEELIRLAEAAGIPFNELLLSQAENAAALAKALGEVLTTQMALSSLSGLTAGAGSSSNQPFDPSFGGAPVPTTPLYQYNSLAQSSLPRMALGGLVPGNGMVDKIATLLTPGEYVVNKNATKQFKPLLSTLNESRYPSMLGSNMSADVPIVNNSTSLNNNSTAVYNYSLGFNINGSNSNPSDIARVVMREIKNVDSQRVRGQRI